MTRRPIPRCPQYWLKSWKGATMTEHQATIVATRQVEASRPAQAPRENQRRGRRFGLATEHGGLLCVLLAACVVMTILSPNFLTQDNLLDVGRQISFTGII